MDVSLLQLWIKHRQPTRPNSQEKLSPCPPFLQTRGLGVEPDLACCLIRWLPLHALQDSRAHLNHIDEERKRTVVTAHSRTVSTQAGYCLIGVRVFDAPVQTIHLRAW